MRRRFVTWGVSLAFFSFFYAQKQNKVLETEFMDLKARPQDDFYRYVNGGWERNAVIPSDKGSWGSFNELREKNDIRTLDVLRKAVEKRDILGSDERKTVDYFLTIVDTARRDAQKLLPIQPFLQKIDAIEDLRSLQQYLIENAAYGLNPFFHVFGSPDMKNSNVNITYLDAAVLGLDRDYYQKSDPVSKEKTRKYRDYVARMLRYLDRDAAAAVSEADSIVALEARLAREMLPREELRDDNKLYNLHGVKDLKNFTSSIDWNVYLSGIGLSRIQRIVVREPRYLKALDEVFRTVPLERVKDLLRWLVLNDAAPRLSSDLEREHFDFYSKTLKGIPEMKPLDKRALHVINNDIGEPLGKLYIKEVFPPRAKEDMQELVRYLSNAYRSRIQNLTWMSETTKKAALGKLGKFTVKVGYPDEGGWKDYSALVIKPTSSGGAYYINYLNLKKWYFQDRLKQIGQLVNKKEWYMSPQEVNAYYDPTKNEIVFPAAILQPPFYGVERDAALNFGGIGAVIGHEISHGFDDSGSRFDGDGNLRNWWQTEDKERFDSLTRHLINQYDSYIPLEGMHVNGKATLGENIADLGGLSITYDALQTYLKDKGTPGLIDGFTPSQRFFISWAVVWRTKTRPDALKDQIKTDFHAPGQYRAIGPLSNVDAFYQVFDVKKGDKMYKAPEFRIKIW